MGVELEEVGVVKLEELLLDPLPVVSTSKKSRVRTSFCSTLVIAKV